MSEFIRAALIRAARTAAQAAIAGIGTAAALDGVSWAAVASVTAMATILSLLNSVATGLPEVG